MKYSKNSWVPVPISQDLGVQIYESAGFEVKLIEKSYYLFEDGKKRAFVSDLKSLSDLVFIVRHIKRMSFDTGFEVGWLNKQLEIKKSLGL